MALSRHSGLQYGAIIRNSTLKPWITPVPSKSVRESLYVHLTNPKTNDELLILGTSNISTSNAYRNFEVASQFNPTSVLLQVSPHFGKHCFGSYPSSEAFQNSLNHSGYFRNVDMETSSDISFRSLVFHTRKNILLFWLHNAMRTPFGMWRFFTPGMDSKLIFEMAQKDGKQIVFGGEDFDGKTMEGLKLETRMDAIFPYLKFHFGLNDSWDEEALNWKVLFSTYDVKSIAEGHLTQDNVAWLVKFAEKLLPHQKKIIIDAKDEDIFWNIEKKMTGNKKLVLVNQWHMDGVQRYWRKYHGLETVKKTLISTDGLPLEEITGWMKEIDKDRERVEKTTGFPMALKARENSSYWDQNRSHYA